MAIKDQCAQCAYHSSGICNKIGGYPSFDQTSCGSYRKMGSGIDLEKKGRDASLPPPTPSPVYTPSQSANTNNSHSSQSGIYEKQRMFSKPFSFDGRIRRLEYGLSLILVYVYIFIAGSIIGAMRGGEGLVYIFLIPMYWFIWAQGAKRCHDRDNSGWYQIIPFYGLWMLFAEGDPGDNSYGPNPKQ